MDNNEIKLKRVLGLPEAIFIAVGFTIGGGVFVFTGIVLKITGTALPLSYLLAVIPIFFMMLPVAILGSALPAVGGNYRYPAMMVSKGLAFVGIWTYALASFWGQIPLYSLGCARYVNVFLPGVSPAILAIIIITIFYIINLLGVKPAAIFQGLMVIILVSALLYFSHNGIEKFHPENFKNFLSAGADKIILGTALLTFTYMGSNGIIELGGEIKNPGKVIPAAIFSAIGIVAIIYLLLSIAVVGSVNWKELVKHKEPLIASARSILPHSGFNFFIIGGAVLALLTTLNALFIVGTKSLLAIISDGLLPESLGKINDKFGTPHILLTIIWVLSILGILSGFELKTFASYASLGGMVIFFPLFLAGWKLPTLYP